jgi:shikimate dehydrogenase
MTGIQIEKRFVVIGDPIEHSLSPALFAFVFRELGLPHRYRAVRVRSDELAVFVRRVRAGGLAGVNVTIPHKERIIAHLDALDETAQAVGAVNAVTVGESGWGRTLIGCNMDVAGVSGSLARHRADVRGKRAVVLGAGGAARAAICALISLGISEIAIVNRTRERAERLIAELARATGFSSMGSIEPNDSQLAPTIREAKLLVNATPVGMHPRIELCPLDDLAGLHEGLVVFDLVYNPLETRLLRLAAARGAQTIDGLDMLIHQAFEALRIWLDCDVPDALFEKVRAHLAEHLSA